MRPFLAVHHISKPYLQCRSRIQQGTWCTRRRLPGGGDEFTLGIQVAASRGRVILYIHIYKEIYSGLRSTRSALMPVVHTFRHLCNFNINDLASQSKQHESGLESTSSDTHDKHKVCRYLGGLGYWILSEYWTRLYLPQYSLGTMLSHLP
jgi:hypothetical protein